MPTIDLAQRGSATKGRLDRLIETYVFDHKPARLEVVLLEREDGPAVPGSRFDLLRSETLSIRHTSNAQVSIQIGDVTSRLTVSSQKVKLAGTGGNEGTAANKGQPAPFCFGRQRDLKGVRISTQDQIWLVHRDFAGNPARNVFGVRVGQQLYSPDDYEVTYGESTTVFITTDVPDGLEPTFDVLGPEAAGDDVAANAKYLLVDMGPLSLSEINLDRFSKFAAAHPFQSQLYVDDGASIVDCLNRLTAPAAWWGADQGGLIDLGLNISPQLDHWDYEIPQNQILEVEVLAPTPPARSVTTCYDNNPTVVGEDGIAGAAKGTERAAWAQTPYRRLTASNSQYLAIYPSARTPDDYVLALSEQADAALVHKWLVQTYATKIGFYRVRLALPGIRIPIGRVVRFSYPRWGLDTVSQYRVAQVTINEDRTTDLIVWRNGARYVLGAGSPSSYLVTSSGAPLGA